MNVDTSHFYTKPHTYTKLYDLDEILVDNSHYTNAHHLKKRLVSEGRLKYKCDICGNKGEWNGKPLSLQLDHKNGKHLDHRLENLRLLCPNCHSQTDSFSGKNKNKNNK